jgi:tRNA1Val (adenine37-N6)-methyltransferase
MGNSYFQFKQFRIEQEGSAMKVCTDSCIFGAYIASQLPDQKNVLDIGAGTGLLSLMYAQMHPNAQIDAVEIVPEAAQQTLLNFKASPWSKRFQVLVGDVKSLKLPLYDFVFSNPPFFLDDLKSADKARNEAMHATSLNYPDLATVLKACTQPNGTIAILLPNSHFHSLEKCLLPQWRCYHTLNVKQTPKHDYFRTIGLFTQKSEKELPFKTNSITIQDENRQYTPEFTALLKPYYLHL